MNHGFDFYRNPAASGGVPGERVIQGLLRMRPTRPKAWCDSWNSTGYPLWKEILLILSKKFLLVFLCELGGDQSLLPQRWGSGERRAGEEGESVKCEV